MKSKYNSLKLGIILGFIVPIISLFVSKYIFLPDSTFQHYFEYALKMSVVSKIISICVIPNLLLFFLFLNKDYNLSAKGVLTATIIFAVIVIVTRFLI